MKCRRHALASLLGLSGCGHEVQAPPALPPPAQVHHAITEDALTTVALTPEAVARLGIVSEPVASGAIPRSRHFGAFTVVPPGRMLTVSAAVAGRLASPLAGTPPRAGDRVAAGIELFQLTPLVAPEAQANLAAAAAAADGAASVAAARLAAAESALARAEQILRDAAGSARAVEEARAARDAAAATLSAANAQREALLAKDDGPGRRMTVATPVAGVLTQVHASPGVDVPAGAPLFEILDDTTLWLEVPVHVGDLPTLDTAASVRVGAPGAPAMAMTRTAAPVSAPPSANAAAATVSLFYGLDNADHTLRPGQRLGANVPLRGTTEQVASIPAAAIVFDAHGGTWAYERVDASTFARRRVEVSVVHEGRAILARGAAPGTQFVTVGAAELFGTEFFEKK